MRHRDLHILTVATYTYTSDQRFTATYHRDTNEWTLQIKWAQKRDAGAYECQISTQPVKSYSIDLSIVGKLKLLLNFFPLCVFLCYRISDMMIGCECV